MAKKAEGLVSLTFFAQVAQEGTRLLDYWPSALVNEAIKLPKRSSL